MSDDGLYTRFLANAKKSPLYHRRCEIEERTAEDPGWPFLPEELYLLAERRQLEPAEYHFTMGVLRGLRQQKQCGTHAMP